MIGLEQLGNWYSSFNRSPAVEYVMGDASVNEKTGLPELCTKHKIALVWNYEQPENGKIPIVCPHGDTKYLVRTTIPKNR